MKTAPARPSANAFTVLELLVVLAILGLLLASIAPPSRKRPGKPGYSQVTCMNNIRQLSIAWIMYADDHDTLLVPNRPLTPATAESTNNWVGGILDWSERSSNTNVSVIRQAKLFPYVRYEDAFRCPDDLSMSAAGLRIRSYSMNAFVGDTYDKVTDGWKRFVKLSDFKMASPQTFLFIEEHPNSIDDGSFVNDPAKQRAWMDFPALFHPGGTVIGFADGHAEMHRWACASTRPPVRVNGPKPQGVIPSNESGEDLAWLLEHTTRKAEK